MPPAALLLVLSAASAQPVAPHTLTVSAGWLGEAVTHPGAFVDVEEPLVVCGPHAFVLGARAGGYDHFGHHTGLLALAQTGWRVTAPFGLYGELLGSAGVHERFLAGPVYVETRSGGVAVGTDAGRPTFMAGLALGAGWQLGAGGPWPDRLFVRVDGWERTTVNQAWLPVAALSAGVAWTLSVAP